MKPARMRSRWAKMLPWAYTERRQPTRAVDVAAAVDEYDADDRFEEACLAWEANEPEED